MDSTAKPPLFPTFTQPYLRSFLMCGCFKLGDTAASQLVKEQSDEPKRVDIRFRSEKGPVWIRIRYGLYTPPGQENPRGRYQIECRSEAQPSGLSGTRATAKAARKLLAALLHPRGDAACCDGIFTIPEKKIPPNGFVGLLLGASARAGKATMNLTGATFQVKGYSPCEKISWNRKVLSGRQSSQIEVTIRAYPTASEIAQGPENVASILWDGIKRLVIDTGE